MANLELLNTVFSPKNRIEYSNGSVVSQQLIINKVGNITLFAFDKSQQLSEHTAPFDAVCHILDGEVEIRVGETTHKLTEGEMLIMPANIPHAVFATERFKMLLTMIKG